jgi:homocitrate synthase NifV
MEVGIPAMGEHEVELIREITAATKRANTMVWARMVDSDLSAALRCGADIVHLSISVSDIQIERKLGRDRDWMLAPSRFVDHAANANATSASASRTPAADPFPASGAVAHGARCACAGRHAGPARPFGRMSARRCAASRHHIDHATTTSAHRQHAAAAGASHASTTVNGLGERAGNAALEEVVMAARHLYGVDCGVDTTRLPRISQLVAQASGRPVSAGKSIVGAAVFTHESGIHVDGLLKDRGNYEAFRPEEVGSAHRLVLGSTGSHGVRAYARAALARHWCSACSSASASTCRGQARPTTTT